MDTGRLLLTDFQFSSAFSSAHVASLSDSGVSRLTGKMQINYGITSEWMQLGVTDRRSTVFERTWFERCRRPVVLHGQDDDIAGVPQDVHRVVMWTGRDVFTVYLEKWKRTARTFDSIGGWVAFVGVGVGVVVSCFWIVIISIDRCSRASSGLLLPSLIITIPYGTQQIQSYISMLQPESKSDKDSQSISLSRSESVAGGLGLLLNICYNPRTKRSRRSTGWNGSEREEEKGNGIAFPRPKSSIDRPVGLICSTPLQLNQ
uniref:Uncharacterized protein n=1 Tax=Anopheles farauti TaxID=69004 RepID=A0A182QZY1_9DIPT